MPKRVERAAIAAPTGEAAARELGELRQRVAKLTADLEESRRQEAELKNRREWRWGSALLNVATLGGSKRKP